VIKRLQLKLLLFLCILHIANTYSQQLPQFTFYQTVPLVYNPSVISLSDQTTINVGARWQMLGFGQEPLSSYTSFKMRINKPGSYNPSLRVSKSIRSEMEFEPKFLGHYVGGYFLADNYGAFRKLNFSAMYSSGVSFYSGLKLTGGMRFGLSNHSFFKDKAVVLNPSDFNSAYSGGDNTYDNFVLNQSNQLSFDLSAGFSLAYNGLVFGLSAAQITKDYLTLSASSVNFNRNIHWHVFGAYLFPISQNSEMQVSSILKQVAPFQYSIEGSFSFYVSNNWFFGANYRHSNSLGVFAGYCFDSGFSVSYALDIPINNIYLYSQGGHEFLLVYTLGNNIRPSNYISTF